MKHALFYGAIIGANVLARKKWGNKALMYSVPVSALTVMIGSLRNSFTGSYF